LTARCLRPRASRLALDDLTARPDRSYDSRMPVCYQALQPTRHSRRPADLPDSSQLIKEEHHVAPPPSPGRQHFRHPRHPPGRWLARHWPAAGSCSSTASRRARDETRGAVQHRDRALAV
jgi:hypothetical protein